ncbi:MAG: UDP-N-acetylmuramoyl-tripeptide--D-alanyl-D-alanine ligase [Verrucomicrobiae bacterium]|nr:UDP-N-acetylmuramoyl-tripeptide--D-alanyl-D-alanine ligase [Verrucomicrobiae bacterium]
MERLTLENIARLAGGRIKPEDGRIQASGVCTDSRTVKAGDLFVALKGDRFNGHDFLETAALGGAVAALVEQGEMKKRQSPLPMVLVDDVLAGFQTLAGRYRETLPAKTVGVAGSNGKTGTKELIAAVLGVRFSTTKNEGNLNNHIGVPASLLRLNAGYEMGVFEAGTNHPGELMPLLKLIRPEAGVVTCIGEEHLEFFRDLAGVAQEEGAMAEVLPADGLLALKADDPWSEKLAARCHARIAWFGFGPRAVYRAGDLKMGMKTTDFTLFTPVGTIHVELPLVGRHQVGNALAAAAIGEFFGLSLAEIRQGLENVKPARMRMEQRMTRDGVTILNDAYNANPNSMLAAFTALSEMPVEGRRLAVLGAMRELGDSSAEEHRRVGRELVSRGMDFVVVVGGEAAGIAEGVRSIGAAKIQLRQFDAMDEAAAFVRREARRGDAVLLKASRGVALEQIAKDWD